MEIDRWGLPIAEASVAVAGHLGDAWLAYGALRQSAGDHLKAAFADGAEVPLVRLSRAAFLMLFARADFAAKAAADLALVPASLPAREAAYRDAVQAWIDNRFEAAAERLKEHLAIAPTDFLAVKLQQYLLFYLGSGAAMAAASQRLIDAWGDAVPGSALIYGCRAFDLEEAGALAEAEMIGRAAVEREPLDLWGTHAVAHVLEMQGRAVEGLAWLSQCEPHWQGANPFIGHVWWHRALMLLTLGRVDEALDLYDGAVAGSGSDDTLDLANAVSLLWRLQRHQAPIGDRWQRLALICRRRAMDVMLPFLDLHLALAFAEAEQEADLSDLVGRIAARCHDDTTAGRVHKAVGHRVATALLAMARGHRAEGLAALVPALEDLTAIGGSHAQRDVFWQVAITAAHAEGSHPLATMLLAQRPGYVRDPT
ncbi:MAG: hypothetical protein SF002_09000 [Alphaproteobacteria bacterium]|nr:hypothetical protein [Alphaproteobacteria bacterium]